MNLPEAIPIPLATPTPGTGPELNLHQPASESKSNGAAGETPAAAEARQPGPDPQQWLAESGKVTGTWWEHWTDWLLKHSSDKAPAPKKLGGGGHAPGDQAPGLYVRDLLPA